LEQSESIVGYFVSADGEGGKSDDLPTITHLKIAAG